MEIIRNEAPAAMVQNAAQTAWTAWLTASKALGVPVKDLPHKDEWATKLYNLIRAALEIWEPSEITAAIEKHGRELHAKGLPYPRYTWNDLRDAVQITIRSVRKPKDAPALPEVSSAAKMEIVQDWEGDSADVCFLVSVFVRGACYFYYFG
jgi:hypothetical protein